MYKIIKRGEIADQIVLDVQKVGGKITKKDLKNYEAIIRPALITEILDLKFLGIKPPASSATIALMLKIMESILNFEN